MEAFEIAYDEETKKWVKRPCTSQREEPVPRTYTRHVPTCVIAIMALQIMVSVIIFLR